MLKIKTLKPLMFACAFMGLGLTVAGCETNHPSYRGISNPLHQEKPTSEYNYKAAEEIMLQSAGRIDASTPLLVGTLSNIDKIETSSSLGRVIAEQISTRFVQSGYSVAELKLRNSVNIQNGRRGTENAGEYMLSRDVQDIAAKHKAAAVLTGTYAVAQDEVLVNLRLVDVAGGSVIAATDYSIPKTGNIEKLLADDRVTFFNGGEITY